MNQFYMTKRRIKDLRLLWTSGLDTKRCLGGLDARLALANTAGRWVAAKTKDEATRGQHQSSKATNDKSGVCRFVSLSVSTTHPVQSLQHPFPFLQTSQLLGEVVHPGMAFMAHAPVLADGLQNEQLEGSPAQPGVSVVD